MSHRKAKLTPFGRLLLVQRIMGDGWLAVRAAESVGGRAQPLTGGFVAIARTEPRDYCVGDPAEPEPGFGTVDALRLTEYGKYGKHDNPAVRRLLAKAARA